MCAQATRLSDRQLKAVKPKDKGYVLSDGDGLQLRVRVNGSKQTSTDVFFMPETHPDTKPLRKTNITMNNAPTHPTEIINPSPLTKDTIPP